MMRRSVFSVKRQAIVGGRVVIERAANKTAERRNALLRSVMVSGNYYANNLTDEDGKQQFVYGYTPMDADHRVGHA